MPRSQLETLEKLLRLGHKDDHPVNLDDVVFIAIDFEYFDHITPDDSKNLNSQVGLAILYGRDLKTASLDSVITTYNFACGISSYCNNAAKKFLFGTSATIERKDMLKSIESLIPKSHYVVLVGHQMSNDLIALKTVGFNLQNIGIVVDTIKIANSIGYPRARLGFLLHEFGIPAGNLHCAGNDANFTLRLLLLLAISRIALPSEEQYRQRLKDIARQPLPEGKQIFPEARSTLGHWGGGGIRLREEKNRLTQMKRLQEIFEFQAESWNIASPALKEQLRQERAFMRQRLLDVLESDLYLDDALNISRSSESNSQELVTLEAIILEASGQIDSMLQRLVISDN